MNCMPSLGVKGRKLPSVWKDEISVAPSRARRGRVGFEILHLLLSAGNSLPPARGNLHFGFSAGWLLAGRYLLYAVRAPLPGSETNPVPAGEGSAEPWLPAPLCLRLPLPNTCPLPLSCLLYLSLFSALNLAVAPPEAARLRPCLRREGAPGLRLGSPPRDAGRTSPPCLGDGPRCSAGGGPCFPHRPPLRPGPAI